MIRGHLSFDLNLILALITVPRFVSPSASAANNNNQQKKKKYIEIEETHYRTATNKNRITHTRIYKNKKLTQPTRSHALTRREKEGHIQQ